MRFLVVAFLVLGCSQDHVAADEQRSAAAEEDEFDAGVRVRVSTPDVDKITGRIEKLTAATLLIKLDGESRSISVPFVELTMPTLKAQQLILKRMIDVVGAAVGLVVLSPFLILVALAVKLDSHGPVFFSHERVGLGGRVFRLLKFRTMRDGADEEKGEVAHLNSSGDPRLFKIPNDPRVTRFGAWIRRWSIDELPQLWNVLRGEMSLVGPRPFFEKDLADYSDHHFARLSAKPGITGLWQVKGRSDVVNFEEVVRLDREYIDSWSLWLDLKILWATVPTVVRRTGAY